MLEYWVYYGVQDRARGRSASPVAHTGGHDRRCFQNPDLLEPPSLVQASCTSRSLQKPLSKHDMPRDLSQDAWDALEVLRVVKVFVFENAWKMHLHMTVPPCLQLVCHDSITTEWNAEDVVTRQPPGNSQMPRPSSRPCSLVCLNLLPIQIFTTYTYSQHIPVFHGQYFPSHSVHNDSKQNYYTQ